jgi:LacI family transcriptional regulator
VLHSNRRQLTALEAAVPVVYIDRYLKKRCHYIMNDNLASGAALTQRLLDRGTHPAYLGSSIAPRNMAVLQRGQGYLRTMALHGKEPILVPRSKRSARYDDSERAGYEHMVEWLAAGASPSGLFCATDTLALGAMQALRESGREPGSDVLVVGHDDLSFSAFVHPALTTVRQPKAKIGRAAVEVIAERLELNHSNAGYIHRIYSSELIIRESG